MEINMSDETNKKILEVADKIKDKELFIKSKNRAIKLFSELKNIPKL